MILEDLKNYMSQTVEDTAVYLNYDSSIKREDAVLLWLNASSVSDVGEKAAVRVVVKCGLMQDAMTLSEKLYNLFYPPKQYQKLMDINGSKMYIAAGGLPVYTNCDESGRHCFSFDLNIVRCHSEN